MKEFAQKLYLLMKESTITQSMIVMCVFGPLAYCVVAGMPIPEVIIQYGMLIIGFFFGSKSGYMLAKGV